MQNIQKSEQIITQNQGLFRNQYFKILIQLNSRMSTEVVMQGEILSGESVLLKYKQMQTQLQSSIHEHKKALLEAKSELQFERNRANEFEQKFKSAIRYQNEEKQLKKIMNELNQKLRAKQNETLQLLKSEQEKKKKISQLHSDIEQLETINQEFQQKIKQIQEGAVSAIIEKENIIAELQQKLNLIEINESANSSNLNVAMMELQEKYKELQDRSEATRLDLESLLEQKQQELKELQQKSQHQKQKFEERVTRLEQEIQDYEKHIQHLNEERTQEENLEEKYYVLEQKLRKSEKKSSESELIIQDMRKQFEESLVKFTTQEEQHKNLTEEIKSLKLRIKELQGDVKEKEKSYHELKIQHEKSINEINKKASLLQNERKKAHELLDTKNIEVERLRIEIEQKILELTEQRNRKALIQSGKVNEQRLSLAAQIKNVNAEKIISPVKMAKKQSQDQSRLIEKLKTQIADLQQNNSLLNKKLEQKTNQIQELRQRLVAESGSASRSQEEEKLMIEIEDLNNHIKKLQNSLITDKYKYAEDENFWKMKEKSFKIEIENMNKQFKKEKSELLERIDRMKKTVSGKDKKMDYYQSGFK